MFLHMKLSTSCVLTVILIISFCFSELNHQAYTSQLASQDDGRDIKINDPIKALVETRVETDELNQNVIDTSPQVDSTTTTSIKTTTTTTISHPETSSETIPSNGSLPFELTTESVPSCEDKIVDGKHECDGAERKQASLCDNIVIPQDSLTGDKICAEIGRQCQANNSDRFLRCICSNDEYFLFLTRSSFTDETWLRLVKQYSRRPMKDQSMSGSPGDLLSIFYSSTSAMKDTQIQPDSSRESRRYGWLPNYIAECLKIDKCLGVRCRQLSEYCHQGECKCNQNLGYIKDPKDNQCKLLNPCLVYGDQACGEAKCVPTFNRELYRCICPIGYRAHRVITGLKNSTQCYDPMDEISDVPLLNKCEHECKPSKERNGCKCTCFRGYRSGSIVGENDHKCYYIEDLNYAASHYSSQKQDLMNKREEPRAEFQSEIFEFVDIHQKNNYKNSDLVSRDDTQRDDRYSLNEKGFDSNLPSERCRKTNCKTNEICVIIEHNTSTCRCDRLGYVTHNGSCLDWCTAARYNLTLASKLDKVCFSGLCKIKKSNREKSSQTKVLANGSHLPERNGNIELEIASSPRPTFKCDCSTSDNLVEDPETGLCKPDLRAIIEPCLPGGEGYEDCVVKKSAYCSVLYRKAPDMLNDMKARRLFDPQQDSSSSGALIKHYNSNSDGENGKSYTCVCSPEKKILVDQPRNKSKCVKECDLLNNECVRFNRMCKRSTFKPNDFLAHKNLIRKHGIWWEINTEQTGCECLPGFSGRPESSESENWIQDEIEDDENESPLADNGGTREVRSNDQGVSERHMRINSSCLLDQDVIRLINITFKAPANFDPYWVKVLENEAYKENKIEGLSDEQFDNSDNWWKSRVHEDGSIMGPDWMHITDIDTLTNFTTLVGKCELFFGPLSLEAYRECAIYRYWQIHKLRKHFVDWRKILTSYLNETFFLMEGGVRVRIDSCKAILKEVKSNRSSTTKNEQYVTHLIDLTDDTAVVDADLVCNLTLHTAFEESKSKYKRNTRLNISELLEPLIFKERLDNYPGDYYLMAPNMLIHRNSIENLNSTHAQDFQPCNSDLDYCGKQTTDCVPGNSINFACTCKYGYTPIGSRDISFNDSRRDVCEDINECLFGACMEVANISKCVNLIGDYRCECYPGYVKDGKGLCKHACDTISCKNGVCKLLGDHHATCECYEGYTRYDCSILDPSVALRKANMIICGSILMSVLLLAITIAISQNRQLKKIKKEMKRLESEQLPIWSYDIPRKQTAKHRSNKTTVT